MLWFGWFGFNAGSALAANDLAANAFVATHVATAAAGLTWEAETSADLKAWARGGGTVLQSSNNLFKVRDNVCATTNAQHFLRLNVAY